MSRFLTSEPVILCFASCSAPEYRVHRHSSLSEKLSIVLDEKGDACSIQIISHVRKMKVYRKRYSCLTANHQSVFLLASNLPLPCLQVAAMAVSASSYIVQLTSSPLLCTPPTPQPLCSKASYLHGVLQEPLISRPTLTFSLHLPQQATTFHLPEKAHQQKKTRPEARPVTSRTKTSRPAEKRPLLYIVLSPENKGLLYPTHSTALQARALCMRIQ